MHEPVSHSDDGSPWQLAYFGACLCVDFRGCLAGDFHRPNQGEQKHLVAVEIASSSTGCEVHRRMQRVHQMLKPHAIMRKFVLHLSFANDFVTKIAAQILSGAQIDVAAIEQGRQLLFDVGQIQKAGPSLGPKFHQEVYIAVGARRALESRTEQRQAADLMPVAEGCKGYAICEQAIRHCDPSLETRSRYESPEADAASVIF